MGEGEERVNVATAELIGLTHMHRQPDRRLTGICPSHAMPTPRRDEQIIAHAQSPRLGLVLELYGGVARDDQHPLRPTLVVPETGQARLAGRNDTLDPNAG
jgi:hypothetical protein